MDFEPTDNVHPISDTSWSTGQADLKIAYLETVTLAERLHRRFLEGVQTEIERSGFYDISNVQALILFSMNDDEVSVGDLAARGSYSGTNVSYNLKKLVERGYVYHVRSTHDGRSSLISLTLRGRAFREWLREVHDRDVVSLAREGITQEDIEAVQVGLKAVLRAATTSTPQCGPAVRRTRSR